MSFWLVPSIVIPMIFAFSMIAYALYRAYT